MRLTFLLLLCVAGTAMTTAGYSSAGSQVAGHGAVTRSWISITADRAVMAVEDHAFLEPTSWTDEYRRILELFERTLRE